MCDQNVGILTKNDLFYLLLHIQYLPIRKDAHAQIMAGDNKGKFVTIQNVDFTENRATVLDSEKNEYDVLVSFLKNVDAIDSDSLSKFMSKLQKICNEADLLYADEIEIAIKRNGNKLTTEIEKQKVFVHLKQIQESKYEKQKRMYQANKKIVKNLKTSWLNLWLSPQGASLDYLRNKMISCSCLAWAEQDTNINLCKHQIILLYN